MGFWSFIGELLFFRWLFDTSQQKARQDKQPESDSRQSLLNDDVRKNDTPVYRSNSYNAGYTSYDHHVDDDYDIGEDYDVDLDNEDDLDFSDFHDDYDDYDMFDDDF